MKSHKIHKSMERRTLHCPECGSSVRFGKEAFVITRDNSGIAINYGSLVRCVKCKYVFAEMYEEMDVK